MTTTRFRCRRLLAARLRILHNPDNRSWGRLRAVRRRRFALSRLPFWVRSEQYWPLPPPCRRRAAGASRASAAHLDVGRRTDLEAYAERLARVAPMPHAKVYFTNSGTESVEAALKLVRYATARPMLSRSRGDSMVGRWARFGYVVEGDHARGPRAYGWRRVHGPLSAPGAWPDARGDRRPVPDEVPA